ncbi:Hpt domain-containing protein [Rhodospirillum rubrum]|uniref:Hpt domain protein n=1 Tax=Rhodospirillum rubrum (strain ATCC 11170 / ATH 1.1.1 / DSM 467 / LMG 4362 / NCIMB 8255 / S1) TaxID=269796 RepID=Q2RNK8_RHORT|nr:Hpt domain-containing protein [Rhodospirillum rubrum]ABC24287.1 Hpt domain protein [Rhodospirillum rubrum ATCC 11170]AEO50038.1 Hpt domain-containing protein [Rhodospirillum rubrum F11]MBK5956006.1 Hpt domain-containing protein [Rhodospirillum rubrum]QXG80215.1 Hpt domain-containing protein [Rhodospirillum rubrum]HAP99058.1 Hpt domain-containing protein [Rhodospirillum rubrum]
MTMTMLDMGLLNELKEDLGEEVLAGLLAHFIGNSKARLTRLAAALESGALREAGREAHSLKGIAASLGMPDLAAFAGVIEETCRTGDLDSARAQAHGLPELLERTVVSLGDHYTLPNRS